MYEVAGGILGVGVDVVADGAADPGALQRTENLGEGDQVTRIGDGSKFVGDGRQAGVLDGVRIEEARVEVADLLRVGPDRGVRRRALLDDRAHVLFRLVVQRPKRPVDGPVRGNGVLVQPLAVHVDEQVVLRPSVRVRVAEVDTRVRLSRIHNCHASHLYTHR